MKSETADDLAKTASELLKEYVPAPWGKLTAIVVSRYGKYPIQYLLPETKSDVGAISHITEQPNFAVVGMGRCGSHVAVALHQMVFKEARNTHGTLSDESNGTSSLRNWSKRIFGSKPGRRALAFKPVMLVGDTDETTFADVAGLTSSTPATDGQDAAGTSVLTLSYAPLASAGVGHNPIISQFFTRALLLSPEIGNAGQKFGWSEAKRFLLAIEARPPVEPQMEESGRVPPRLAFYVFSAGGGTGCGAAAEILRAQQFAAVSAQQSSLTYYCAVAVLPEADRKERRRMLNVGRFMVQYLADQAIILNSEDDYNEVPKYRGGSLIAPLDGLTLDKAFKPGTRSPVPMSSWNSVLLVSNEIMNPSSDSLEKAIQLSNQYIAQQLFNLAGPQISASNLTLIDPQRLPTKNFEAIRLDAMDLLSSLRGPSACCFAVAATRESRRDQGQQLDWIREMFLRAISLPTLRDGVGLIEGISISPCDSADYSAIFTQGTLEEIIARCAELPFFRQCGSIVFTLTAPQDGTLMQSELDELMRLCGSLFQNLKETRYSAIYGTTSQYTISVYIEGSVVFAPEIERSVRNYLYLCWPLARKMGKEVFEKWWKDALEMDPPITAEAVARSLGSEEDLQSEYPGLPLAKQLAVRSWESLGKQMANEQDRPSVMSQLGFDQLAVKASEVAAALSFYNYFAKRGWLETLD